MLYKVGPRALLYPTAVWLIILLVLFATEYAVMLVLPVLMRSEPSPLVAALIDAVTITAVLAPVIWWTLVRPLREVIRLRTRFLGDLFTAIEVERRQTACELHDGIGQQLSLLVSGLRSAHESLNKPEDAARCRDLQNLAQTALSEIKRIALGLRPSLLDDLGLLAAIDKVVRDCREHSSIAITLQAAALEGIRLPDFVETPAFRIVQEALANVLRHSGARHAIIEMGYAPGQLTVTISDDGRGFEPWKKPASSTEGTHMGLTGIRERVALLGGHFSLETSPGHGCRLAVMLPTEAKVHE